MYIKKINFILLLIIRLLVIKVIYKIYEYLFQKIIKINYFMKILYFLKK
jgi:hypothetical protein